MTSPDPAPETSPAFVTYQLDLTDTFGKIDRWCELYTGPDALERARSMARYIRAEFTHRGFQDGQGRCIVGVRVRPWVAS